MSTQPMEGGPQVPQAKGLKELVERYERELILKALAESGGHQRRAARALGVLPSTLSEKMRRLDLRPAPRNGSSRS